MARRRCQFCEDPLPWYAPLMRWWNCKDCAGRLMRGEQPLSRAGRQALADYAARRTLQMAAERGVDEVFAGKQALAHPGRYYGDGGTVHTSTGLDVETDATGRVVSVWFRCQRLPFKQHNVADARAIEMDSAPVSVRLTGVEVHDL